MSSKSVETSLMLFPDRFMPPTMVADMARGLEASGVVDFMGISDQLVNFLPPSIWTPENTPLAKILPDPDSHSDAFVMAAYCLAAAPKLKLTLAMDSIRHAPAEMVQTMLTLTNLTGGNTMFHIGGGEVKQTKPYGWKRSEGITRLEDLFRAYHAFMDTNGPIDFVGNHVKFEKAYLGSAKQHRPKLWALGGGPKLIDLATSYGDGLATAVPPVWWTPEQAKEHIGKIKADLRAKGRDPDKFQFGIWCPVMLHNDTEAINRAMDNPLIRWMSAVFGRISSSDWPKVGIESPLPEGWTYYQHMLPYDTSPEFVAEVLRKTTRKIAQEGMLAGTPKQVAEMIRPYIDAGVSWVLPIDYLALVLPPEEGPATFARGIELCSRLKGN